MGRYTGPRRRILRRLGTDLSGLTPKGPGERAYPPGQQGPTAFRRRRRASAFAIHLAEKQKLRYHYGVTEGQLRRYLKRAAAGHGRTGENLLVLLERRLDNVVFRLGLSPSIPAARQLVTHGHVRVDGQRVDIPSYLVVPGQTVDIRPRSRRLVVVTAMAEHAPALLVPPWLERAADGLGGRIVRAPERTSVPFEVREALVVEFYAR